MSTKELFSPSDEELQAIIDASNEEFRTGLVAAVEKIFTAENRDELLSQPVGPTLEALPTPTPVTPPTETVPLPQDAASVAPIEIEASQTRPGRIRRALGRLGLMGAHLKRAKNHIADTAGNMNARLSLRGMEAAENTVTFGARLAKKHQGSHENETPWQRRRRRIFRGIGMTASAMAVVSGVALYTKYGVGNTPASLHHGGTGTYTMEPSVLTEGSDIYVGGHTDPTSQGVDGMLQNTLQQHTNKNLINYPAEMAPLPGDTQSWNESTAIGGQKVVEAALGSGDPNNTHIIGYSEGSQAALNGANRLHDMGYNPKLTLIGTPDAAVSGFFDDPKVKALKPLFDGLGVDITENDVPSGTTIFGKPGDFWVNGGNRPFQTQIGQALGTWFGDTHNYSPKDLTNPQNTSFIGPDGVTYVTVKDDLSGYGHAAQANGLAWSPQAEAFVDAIAPEGKIGQPDPGIDTNNVLQSGANLITDSINRALPPEAPKLPEMPVIDTPPAPAPAPVDVAPAVPDVVPDQIAQPIQQAIDQVIQPAAPAPAPVEMPAPVNVAPAPVADIAPAPVEVAPQISDTINNVSDQIQQAVGGADTPAGQAVGDIAKQANDFIGGLLPH